MPKDFNQHVIDEFRANEGRVGGPFEGARLLLLTTTGARSGAPHTTPLGYLPDGGERVLVIASAAGAPRHPAWYHNLCTNPSVRIETGTFTYEADATVLQGEERDSAFARAVGADPGWAEYQQRTERVLPVVALQEVPGPPVPNAATWGEALKLVHDAFRRELALIRDEIVASGPGIGAQLRVNCLTFCQGLHHHHSGEDQAMFPGLAGAHPELAPVIERLTQEHEKLAALLEEFQHLLSAGAGADAGAAGAGSGAGGGAGAGQLLPEVDRLTAELEAHLAYEEEQLLPLLHAPTR